MLVDRTNPFGNGNVLPRGFLREPARNIARAKFICITKARHGDTDELRRRIRELNPGAGIMECNHEPCASRYIGFSYRNIKVLRSSEFLRII